jgi:hypothetical protein
MMIDINNERDKAIAAAKQTIQETRDAVQGMDVKEKSAMRVVAIVVVVVCIALFAAWKLSH